MQPLYFCLSFAPLVSSLCLALLPSSVWQRWEARDAIPDWYASSPIQLLHSQIFLSKLQSDGHPYFLTPPLPSPPIPALCQKNNAVANVNVIHHWLEAGTDILLDSGESPIGIITWLPYIVNSRIRCGFQIHWRSLKRKFLNVLFAQVGLLIPCGALLLIRGAVGVAALYETKIYVWGERPLLLPPQYLTRIDSICDTLLANSACQVKSQPPYTDIYPCIAMIEMLNHKSNHKIE